MGSSEAEIPSVPAFRPRVTANENNRKRSIFKTNGLTVNVERNSGFPERSPSPEKGSLWNEKVDGSPSTTEDAVSADAERVRVTVRVRPATEEEMAADEGFQAMDIDSDNNRVSVQPYRLGMTEPSEFEFDAVLPPTASQADVYAVAARPIVKDVLNGYNGTIMAYGQTGAGKTYTLSSTQPNHLGIIPQASAEVFNMLELDKDHEYRVSMSYIQIYMEMIQDLLRPSSSNMQIRESEHGVYISGVHEVEVKNIADCLRLLALGERNRTFAFTKLNAHSSRSHAIAWLTVEKRVKGADVPDSASPDDKSQKLPRYQEALSSLEEKRTSGGPASSGSWAQSLRGASFSHNSDDRKTPKAADAQPSPEERRPFTGVCKEKILIGKLFMVDLAGSERLKKSGSEGVRASEAKSINLSLTVLGKCINARAHAATTHVPFRDSKLTRLLQESLGGNAKTSLVVNIAPTADHAPESLSSLQFGSRAMKVKTEAVVNEEVEYRQLSATLQETLDLHDDRVHSLEVVVYSQEEQLAEAKATVKEQHRVIKQLHEDRDLQQEYHDKELQQHRIEMAALGLVWEERLRQALEDAHNSSRQSATHQQDLVSTIEDLSLHQRSLEEALTESQSQTAKLEAQVAELSATISRLEHEKGAAAEKMEEEVRKAGEERAARVIQRSFRDRRVSLLRSQLHLALETVEKGRLKLIELADANCTALRDNKRLLEQQEQLTAALHSSMPSAKSPLRHSKHSPRTREGRASHGQPGSFFQKLQLCGLLRSTASEPE